MAQVSIFIGNIQALPKSGRPSAIYKSLVTNSIEIGIDGIIGDHQADLKVHGGPEKAIHLYPTRHYKKLASRFPEAAAQLIAGSIGENLATSELDENDVRIGDLWQLGSAILQVCQLRNPCWKIDEKFSSEGMANYIAENQLNGWYWRVIQPGRVNVGDALELAEISSYAKSLYESILLWQEHRPNLDELHDLANAPGIAKAWKDKIVQRLNYLKANT